MLPNVPSFDEGPLVQKVFMTPSPPLKATAVLMILTPQPRKPHSKNHPSHVQTPSSHPAPSQLTRVEEKFGLRRERRPVLWPDEIEEPKGFESLEQLWKRISRQAKASFGVFLDVGISSLLDRDILFYESSEAKTWTLYTVSKNLAKKA